MNMNIIIIIIIIVVIIIIVIIIIGIIIKLYSKMSKCLLYKDPVKLLGHIVSADGM